MDISSKFVGKTKKEAYKNYQDIILIFAMTIRMFWPFKNGHETE